MAKSPPTAAHTANASGYAILDNAAETEIRDIYFNSSDRIEKIRNGIWVAVREATAGVEFSDSELTRFIHGESIAEILAFRLQTSGNTAQPYVAPERPKVKVVAPPVMGDYGYPVGSIMDLLFSVPLKVWFIGIILAAVGINIISSSGEPAAPKPPKYLTPEERAIRDEVTIQLMLEKAERERKEKFDREYQRQKREGSMP